MAGTSGDTSRIGGTSGDQSWDGDNQQPVTKPPAPAGGNSDQQKPLEQQTYKPGSTMYEMGFRNAQEYSDAQSAGVSHGTHEGKLVPEGSVIIEGLRGIYEGGKTIDVRVTPSDLAQGAAGEQPTSAGIYTRMQKGEYKIPVEAESERGEKAQKLLEPSQVEGLSGLTDEQRFYKLQEMGVYPSTWTWGSRGTGEEKGEFIITEQRQRERGEDLEAFKIELKSQPEDIQDAYRLGGIEAYNKAVAEYNRKLNTEIRSIYTDLPEDFDSALKEYNRRVAQEKTTFESQLTTVPSYLQAAYKKGGVAAYNNAVAQYNAALNRINKKYEIEDALGGGVNWVAAANDPDIEIEIVLSQKEINELKAKAVALDNLHPYFSQDGYDIAHYLRDKPKGEQTLKTLEFTAEDISQAKEFNKAYLGTGIPALEQQPTKNEFMADYLKAQGLADNQVSVMMMQYKATGQALVGELKDAEDAYKKQYSPQMDLQAYVERYTQDKGRTINTEIIPYVYGRVTGDISKKDSQLIQEAVKSYQDKYGLMPVIESSVGEVAPLVFMPTRAVKPDVEVKDLTPADWIIGGAQLATLGAAMPLGSAARLSLQGAATGAFGYVTAKEWDNMDAPGRALGVTITLLSALPLLRVGKAYLDAKVDPMGVKSKALIESENRLAAETASRISKVYGEQAGDALKTVAQKQGEYIEALVELQKLQSSKLAQTIGKRAISNAESKVDIAKSNLESAAKRYAKSVEGKAGYDSPGLAKLTEDLPKEIAKNAEEAVESLASNSAKIKQLRSNMERANARLRAAQEKYPTDPGKWADLIVDQAIAEGKVKTAIGAKGADMQSNMLKVRNGLDAAKDRLAKLKNNKPADPQKLADWAREKAILEKQIPRLTKELQQSIKELDAYIKRLEVEYGKGGGLSKGGGTKTLIRSKRPSPILERELARAGRSTYALKGGGVMPSIRVNAQPQETFVIGKPIEADVTREGIAPMSVPDIKRAIREASEAQNKQVPAMDINSMVDTYTQQSLELQAQGLNKADIKQSILQAIREDTARMPEMQPKPETQPKPAEQMATKLKTPLKPKTPTPPKPPPLKPKPVLIPRPGTNAPDDKKREYLDKVEGLVARRRGELGGESLWLIDYYPYGPNDKMTLRGAAPRGAKPASGKGSLKASATLIKGVPPREPYFRDTGAVDDIIKYKDGQVIVRSVKDKNVEKKQRSTGKTGMVVRTRDLGGGIEMDKKGRAHIRLA